MKYLKKTNEVAVSSRIGRFFLISLIGMLFCINGLEAFFLYPTGIVVIILYAFGMKFDLNDGGAITLSYSLHLCMLLAFLVASKPRSFRYITIAMIVFTFLNVWGCQTTLMELDSIGK